LQRQSGRRGEELRHALPSASLVQAHDEVGVFASELWRFCAGTFQVC